MSNSSDKLFPSAISPIVLPWLEDTLPQSEISQFVGRKQELQTLHQLLQEHDQVAIAGVTGVGKTELALQYAKANLDYYTGGICWLFARFDLGLQLVELARSHFPNSTIPPGLTPATQIAYCWQHWTPSQGSVLLILDDVTDYQQVKPYLPPLSSRFKVLITTQQQLEKSVQLLHLDVLTPSAALNLLASRIGKYRVKDTRGKPFGVDSKPKKGKQKIPSQPLLTKTPIAKVGQGLTAPLTQGIAEQLCECLGYLPLGLELVGGYLQQDRNLSLQKMQLRLQKQLLALQSPIGDEDETLENLTTQQGVTAAFELNWQGLDEESQQLACLLSVFALTPISWAQVESVFGQLYLPGVLLEQLLNASSDDSEADIENLIKALLRNVEEARGKLLQRHLLQRIGEDAYQVHPLIRALLQEKLEELDLSINIKKSFCQVMVAVAKQIPDIPSDELSEAIAPAIPHVVQAVTALPDWISEEDLSQSHQGLGWFYQSQGFYDYSFG